MMYTYRILFLSDGVSSVDIVNSRLAKVTLSENVTSNTYRHTVNVLMCNVMLWSVNR